MTIDDLINGALKGRGGFLESSNLFAVVGDIKTTELFVMNLQEFFTENLFRFSREESTDGVLIAAYHTEEQARECIDSMRANSHQAPGLILGSNWHILLGNSEKNTLFSFPLAQYYIDYLASYLYKINSGNLALNIFDSPEAAEDAIDLIRYAIKGEK